jgi:hypothetical protein
MEEMTSIEERRLQAHLAPLQRLTPVAPANRARRGVRRFRVAAVVAVGLAGLSIGAAAIAREAFPTRATPNRAPVSLGSGLACRLIGMNAQRAGVLLTARGDRVSWRLTRYVNPEQNGGVIGYADTVDSPPAGTIVEDVADATGGGLVVSVREPGDPNAPPLRLPRC